MKLSYMVAVLLAPLTLSPLAHSQEPLPPWEGESTTGQERVIEHDPYNSTGDVYSRAYDYCDNRGGRLKQEHKEGRVYITCRDNPNIEHVIVGHE